MGYLKNHWTTNMGLFVLIWKHFSCWIQIWLWKFEFWNFLKKIEKKKTCCLHSTSAWGGLTFSWLICIFKFWNDFCISKYRWVLMERFKQFVRIWNTSLTVLEVLKKSKISAKSWKCWTKYRKVGSSFESQKTHFRVSYWMWIKLAKYC